MRILEIKTLSNGSHRNQTSDFKLTSIPEGWAVIPDDMETPNFPFGEIETEEVKTEIVVGVELVAVGKDEDGEVLFEENEVKKPIHYMKVTKWTPGNVPEPTPEPEIIHEPTTDEVLNTLLGVKDNE